MLDWFIGIIKHGLIAARLGHSNMDFANPQKELTENTNILFVGCILLILLATAYVTLTISIHNYTAGIIFAVALVAVLILRFPEQGILFLVFYFPFEEIILKLLPISNNLYSILRYASEACILLILFRIVLEKAWKHSIRFSPIDFIVIFIFCISIVSAVLNNSNAVEVFLFLRTLLRYYLLYYIATNLNISKAYLNSIINGLIIIGILQALVGLAQIIIGEPLNAILTPKPVTIAIAGHSKNHMLLSGTRELGSIWGTTGDPVNLGLFMMVPLALSLSMSFLVRGYRRLLPMSASLVFSLSVLFTFSRGAAISIVVMFMTMLLIRKKMILLLIVGLILSLVIMLAPIRENLPKDYVEFYKVRQSPIQHFTIIFTPKYQKAASVGREFILSEATRETLKHSPLFGHGPVLSSAPEYYLLRDVYWVFILYKIGIIGLLAILLIFIKIGQNAWSVYKYCDDTTAKVFALGCLGLITAASSYNFFGPVMEVRVISSYIWLFAGLLILLVYPPKIIPSETCG